MRQTTLETEGYSMRGVGGKPAIRILQYNVNKSRNKVLAALLEDQRLKTYDVIAIQEPWRSIEGAIFLQVWRGKGGGNLEWAKGHQTPMYSSLVASAR